MNPEVESKPANDLSVGTGIAIAGMWLATALLSIFSFIVVMKLGYFYDAFKDIYSSFVSISEPGWMEMLTTSMVAAMLSLFAVVPVALPLFFATSITMRILVKDD